MPAFCPLCAADDLTSEEVTEDGRRFAVCISPDHGDQGYVWETTPPRRATTRSDGLGAGLDIWDKLLECIPADGRPRAYGDIEDIFLERYPEEAELLQDRYGHRWREGKKSINQYSMSVYLAARLRDLAKEEAVELTWGPAEGPWYYNGVISYWARR